jgi:kynurenine 3-monooxygenase
LGADRETVLICGAGLVGSLLAIYLARMGHDVQLFERHPDPRSHPPPSGRSINLTLCDRGLAALDHVDAGRAAREISVPCKGRMIHAVDGALEFQPYTNRGHALYSIARNDLNRLLLDTAIGRGGVHCHFEKKCVEVDLAAPACTFRDTRTGEISELRARRLFGADGVHSAVRREMQKALRFDFTQKYLDQAYKELHVPPPPGGGWALAHSAIHIWPRGHYMLIGFPNIDRSFTLALHMPYDGHPSYASITSPEALLDLFRTSFPDALPLLPALVEDFFSHPETSMVTVQCSSWTYLDRVALIGDAAHGIVPSYGQGANAGFEDCAVLSTCLQQAGPGDVQGALQQYERQRKPNADAIAALSLEHFIELRELVSDPKFLLRKEIERRIYDLHPDLYMPLYAMVSFSLMPYTEALRRDRMQRGIVDEILAIPEVRDKLGSEEVRAAIAERLQACERGAVC